MKFFSKSKDGGPESPVDGYFILEIKPLFSVALLKFNEGQREKYHTHAFNALTWFISGDMEEHKPDGSVKKYVRSLIPKLTKKDNLHRVKANKDSWCITLRGPWESMWTEYDEGAGKTTVFTHGRNVVCEG